MRGAVALFIQAKDTQVGVEEITGEHVGQVRKVAW
jgi:hypothetical protein